MEVIMVQFQFDVFIFLQETKVKLSLRENEFEQRIGD